MDKEFLTELALIKIGTTNVNLLDGLTFIIDKKWYNFYVKNGNVEIEEI